jgi:uncharacterized protein (DUF1501 family)
MNRRDFLKLSGAIPLVGMAPELLFAKPLEQPLITNNKIVVLVELQGGNDSLNTLIPLDQYDEYKALRPKLALDRRSLVHLSDLKAMHSEMRPLERYWHNGELAWVEGVGHASDNHSHFRSIEIWNKGSHTKHAAGWVQQLFADSDDICGIAINERLGPLSGNKARCLRIGSVHDYFNQAMRFRDMKEKKPSNSLLDHINSTKKEVLKSADELGVQLGKVEHIGKHFINDELGKGLRSVSQLIAGGANVPAYKVALDGFDTHNQQAGKHAGLLKSLANNLNVFAQTMKQIGRWNDVIVMTYSEFGRKATENGGAGTDHGSAASHLILGGAVNGGTYGRSPSLKDLAHGGDLKQTVDFRSVYTTLAENWWQKKTAWGEHSALEFI